MPAELKPGKAFYTGGHKRFHKETRKCFNCDKIGHLSKNCPLPDKRLARKGAQARKGHAMMTAATALKTKVYMHDRMLVDISI
jgi:hypothetical protein